MRRFRPTMVAGALALAFCAGTASAQCTNTYIFGDSLSDAGQYGARFTTNPGLVTPLYVGQAVGFTEEDALTQTVITSVTNIVVTVVAIALIDKIGRRTLLLTGSAGMFVALGAMAWVFAMADKVEQGGEMVPVLSDQQGVVALVAANAFVVFFGMSWGPGVWVLLGEMFNNTIRATALGIAAAAQWLANFAISTSFPVMADIGLGFAYGFYTFFALLSFFFVMRWVPETKGRELEDME